MTEPDTETASMPISAVRHLVAAVATVLMLPVQAFAITAAPVTAAPADLVAAWTGRRLTWADGRVRSDRPIDRRRLGLVVAGFAVGLANAGVLALIGLGLYVAVTVLIGAATGGPVPIFEAGPGQVTWSTVVWFTLPGVVLLFLGVSGLAAISHLDRRAWIAFARPSADDLERQVDRLNTTLADVIAAVDTERRRIERDIHDGIQQRVVALSILLARAERTGDAEQRRDLHRRAGDETRQVLNDLRDVAWRVYPAMLARDGLPAALEALQDRTPIPMTVQIGHISGIDLATESAAYFVVSEAVTNVIKHAEASRISVSVTRRGTDLRLTIEDDGIGGADPTGPGLSGIASRVSARDGRLDITSPVGGPTVVEAELPCE
ncbi:signal transduction histidine kinase [Stackebrandtia endophytica]|uniref:histidine kinase n=1 Tax=Stackebrandtia endophytica TaxID=1496996 RepID=A0A543AY00_9ACTN|nr:ATP-binding protein [Stackebrandtia endophytica]TQL77446.1 signal transduction histidine kinase [Stackebrandtia endophytica]